MHHHPDKYVLPGHRMNHCLLSRPSHLPSAARHRHIEGSLVIIPPTTEEFVVDDNSDFRCTEKR